MSFFQSSVLLGVGAIGVAGFVIGALLVRSRKDRAAFATAGLVVLVTTLVSYALIDPKKEDFARRAREAVDAGASYETVRGLEAASGHYATRPWEQVLTLRITPCRKSPSVGAPVVGYLPKGAVGILFATHGHWVQTRTDRGMVWLIASDVRLRTQEEKSQKSDAVLQRVLKLSFPETTLFRKFLGVVGGLLLSVGIALFVSRLEKLNLARGVASWGYFMAKNIITATEPPSLGDFLGLALLSAILGLGLAVVADEMVTGLRRWRGSRIEA